MKHLIAACLGLAVAASAVPAPARAADEKKAVPAAAAAKPAAGEPLDYTTLTHVVAVDALRAGSHDESGVNEYYFSAAMHALLNSAEERNAEWAKRKKVTVELGVFGDTKIDSLAIWHPDEKAKDVKEIRVEGNAIRELAARAMNEFKTQEGELAVQVDVVMMKKNKRFVFFGDDLTVAKASYFVIPETKFETPLRTNQTLTITDDKGTNVKLSVRYEKPATAAKAADAPKQPPAKAP
jgi:hypothetical protein